MQEKVLLRAEHITKRFPGVIANNDISLEVREGEIRGLLGENGSGKSTFLGMLNGVHPYGSYEGKLYLDGKLLKSTAPSEALCAGIGFVPQEINVLPDLTVAENMFMHRMSRRNLMLINRKRMNEDAKGLLDEYGITDIRPEDRAGILSISQQQLLMIARALAGEPRLLVLDEPTTSLSVREVDQLFVIMRKMKEKGVTQIFVSHKLGEMFEIADTVTILRDGIHVRDYDAKNCSEDELIESMVGRKIEKLYPPRTTTPEEEVLRVEGLTVAHPRIAGKNLIDDVSFSLRKGEVLGLAGLVGAGRTETLRAIFGAFPLKSGKILIGGKDVQIRSEKDALRNGISYVTEDRKRDGLLFETDIAGNIIINHLEPVLSARFFVRTSRIHKRVKQFFDLFGIKAGGLKSSVLSLSGGNQQKVVLSRAMNSEPKILLFDEPTKGIDIGAKNDIYNIINDLTDRGVSIIMVSSELPELLAMSDRLIVMGGGRVKGELTREQASDAEIMRIATS
ncbi:MAG: sugar ABC transporter ATP-binding protein [Christensenellaceae bacterium]|nr:sugar ABC transporter ATP-binding protein [Christensenellaceae bacterium]